MTVYSQLSEAYRNIVDRLLIETGGEGWEVRRAYLTSVFEALSRGHRRFPDLVHPEGDLSVIIAGLVERLGEPRIDGRLQAGIYAASAKPEHRIASAEWFDLHPDEYAIIQREIEQGARLH